MPIGITLTPPQAALGDPGNAIDTVAGQARAAATAGVRTAWLGQRPDYDAITLAAVIGRRCRRHLSGKQIGNMVLA